MKTALMIGDPEDECLLSDLKMSFQNNSKRLTKEIEIFKASGKLANVSLPQSMKRLVTL